MGDDDNQLRRYRSQARQRYFTTASSSSSSSATMSATLDTDEVLARLLAQEEETLNRSGRGGRRGSVGGRGRGRGRHDRGWRYSHAAYMPSDLLITDMRRSGAPSSPSFDAYLQRAAYENQALNEAYLSSILASQYQNPLNYDGGDANLMNLMSRELTDEDYNTLLNLDSDVKNTKGASEIDISRLPTFRYQKKTNSHSNSRNDGGFCSSSPVVKKRRKAHDTNSGYYSGKENPQGIIVIDSDGDNDDNNININDETLDCNGHDEGLGKEGYKDTNGVIVLLDDSPLKNENEATLGNMKDIDTNVDIDRNHTNGSKNDEENDENTSCCICMEDYERGDHVITLPCLHVFHRDCIIPWLKNCATCPIDKSEILQ